MMCNFIITASTTNNVTDTSLNFLSGCCTTVQNMLVTDADF